MANNSETIMTFTAEYPLFVLAKSDPDDIAVIELNNGSDSVLGLVVFTDQEAAEDFRDEHRPSFVLEPLVSSQALANLLTILQDSVSEVVFDPYKMGKRCQTITVAEMLDQLPATDLDVH